MIMPALSSLEDLQKTHQQIAELKKKFPEACGAIAEFLKRNRKIGYKNICKMFTGEATPESLKQN